MSCEIHILVEDLQGRILHPNINWDKLRSEGHELSKNDSMGDDEVIYELQGDENSLKYLVPEPAVKIEYANNNKVLTNIDLIQLNGGGTSCDGHYIYSDSQHAYFIFSQALGQAYTLSIWNCPNCDWVFRSGDEEITPEAVIYHPGIECFIGYEEWHSYAGSGIGFFKISEGRLSKFFQQGFKHQGLGKSRELAFKELPGESGFQPIERFRQDLWSYENAYLAADEAGDNAYISISGQIKRVCIPN